MQDERSDAELLRVSLQEPEAFGVFYDRHVREVLAFFYRRTASAQTAADLTAETFAAAFLHRHRYKDLGVPARHWMLGIARRQLGRFLRRRGVEQRARRRLGMERLAVDDPSLERIEALVDLEPLRGALQQAMASLPPRTVQALSLRVTRELPYAVVAKELGCSEGAARVIVARGLSRLAQLMEEV